MTSLTALPLAAAVIGGGTYLTQQVACDYTGAVLSVQLLLNASVFGVARAVASAAVLASGQQPWSMGSLSGGCRAGTAPTGRHRPQVWAALYHTTLPLQLHSTSSHRLQRAQRTVQILGPAEEASLVAAGKGRPAHCPQHTPAESGQCA